MLSFRPYEPGEILDMPVAAEGKVPPSVDGMARASWAFSATLDGRTVACGGLLRIEPWRALAWAVFAPGLPVAAWKRILRRSRAVLKLAEADGIHCVEAEVAADFAAGHRFARTLGFLPAGECPGRLADGAPMARYVRSLHWHRIPLRVRASLVLAADCRAAECERRAA